MASCVSLAASCPQLTINNARLGNVAVDPRFKVTLFDQAEYEGQSISFYTTETCYVPWPVRSVKIERKNEKEYDLVALKTTRGVRHLPEGLYRYD